MPSLFQELVVALIVPGCAGYAAWKLMPATARRSLAGAMLRWPALPGFVKARLDGASRAASGCGCDGCDHATSKPVAKTPAVQPIVFHPRARR